MRILVFGDSIAQGFWDLEGGWVARVQKYFDERRVSGHEYETPVVFNLGVSADTIADVLKRFDNEAEARVRPDSVIVIAIGVNDTVYRNEEYGNTPDNYKEQLGQLLQKARAHTNKVLFVGLGSVVEERLQPMPWSTTGKCYSSERIWEFEETLRGFCKENNVPIAEVYEALRQEQEKRELMPDGIHPNDEGHQLIADLVLPKLEKLIEK